MRRPRKPPATLKVCHRSRPTATGLSRGTASNPCRSSRPDGPPGVRLPGKIFSRFVPPLQVEQLPVGTAGVGDQKHGGTVPGPLRHLGRREPSLSHTHRPAGESNPREGSTAFHSPRHARRMTAPARTPPEVGRSRCAAAGHAPGPGARHRARPTVRTALQVQLLMDLPRVGPLLPDPRVRRMGQQLALLRPRGHAVVQRGHGGMEPLAATWPAMGPDEEHPGRLRVQQRVLVQGIRGLHDGRRLLGRIACFMTMSRIRRLRFLVREDSHLLTLTEPTTAPGNSPTASSNSTRPLRPVSPRGPGGNRHPRRGGRTDPRLQELDPRHRGPGLPLQALRRNRTHLKRSRRPSPGSPRKRSASACPRSSQSGSWTPWTATAHRYAAMMASASPRRDKTFSTSSGPARGAGPAASAARPASCLRPGWPRPVARWRATGMRWETPSAAGAVGSTALGSHFGASL